ncbi:isoprenyl transferase, partial [Ochrobactrum sp. MR34]|nr:isoprenyl transferase [Ochrobactrum sp. MR34]
FIRRDLSKLHSQNVRVRIIGSREDLASDICSLLKEAETRTAANTGLTLVIAFNYGSRDELARGMRKIAEDVAAGRLKPEAITAEMIASKLD